MCAAGFHFGTVISEDGSVIFRPHPGMDPNGWGSSLYTQPFLPGAILGHATVDAITADTGGILLQASGSVSEGTSDTFGSFTISATCTYDRTTSDARCLGEYTIHLDGALSDATGDLSVLRLASNYLDDVPLLSGGIGDTGDMSHATASGTGLQVSWIPEDQPGFFPQDRVDDLEIAVVGKYNEVDSVALEYPPPGIEAAQKPSLDLRLTSSTLGLPMIFGAIFDTAKAQDPYADNVGITPVVLKNETPITDLEFTIEFGGVP